MNTAAPKGYSRSAITLGKRTCIPRNGRYVTGKTVYIVGKQGHEQDKHLHSNVHMPAVRIASFDLP